MGIMDTIKEISKINQTEKIIRVITKFKGDKSFQEMTDLMNDLPEMKMTRPQLNNWALGLARPSKFQLYYVMTAGSGWAAEFAQALLEIIAPEMII